METLKSIGSTILGVAIFVGLVISTVLLFTFGSKLAFVVQPYINSVAGILFIIDILIAFIAVIPKARPAIGFIIFISSYVFGLSTWIYGLAVTLALWGWFAVIVGVLLGGVGVVPIGMLAAIFHGQWGIFLTLLITFALTFGARIVGAFLIESSENEPSYQDGIIDIVQEDKRSWEDLE